MDTPARYLGPATVPEPLPRGVIGFPDSAQPQRLAITLWDFSWYTAAGPTDPYHDLGKALDEAQLRGYNAIRICAAPLLLAPALGLESFLDDDAPRAVLSTLAALARDLPIEGLGQAPLPVGGYYGQATRWYQTPGGYRIDLLHRFTQLLRECHSRGMKVILSSWEYQQSPSFAGDRTWFDVIDDVPVPQRYQALARAWDRVLAYIAEQGLSPAIALAELHNEGDFSILPPLTDRGTERDGRWWLNWLSARHPHTPVTVSYGKPPHLDMARIDPVHQVGQFHIYAYGVLDALQKEIDIRSEGSTDFPSAAMRALLRSDAPQFAAYGKPAAWKLAATVVTDQMIYGYDWVDPAKWDAWLHAHYPSYKLLMEREITSRITAVSAWAQRHQRPYLVGEGWVGYTPLHAEFEESACGLALAELGITHALARGAWGMVLGSNFAPHHPAWHLIEWQQRQTRAITG